MPMARDVVIVGAARTPIGSFQGTLSSLTAPQLGAIAIKEALERAGVDPGKVEEVWMGNVLQAGQGQAPGRQASIGAGIPDTVPTNTLNKMCGSGLKTVISAAQAIALGEAEVIVAGGFESMSNAPYLSLNMRNGARMGNVQMLDHLVYDGLTDVYSNQHMGMCAEQCAAEFKISRAAQDEFSLVGSEMCIRDRKEGLFKAEIVAVPVPQKKGDPVMVADDEGPKNARPDKIATLKPVFKKDGTVTAANASSINDGGAAVVLMSAERAKAEGKTVLGRITGYATAARKPVEFTIAPADAIKKLFERTKTSAADVDLWEINEAFAVVAIANNQILKLDPNKVNVRGGATSLGHPIGASGARVLITLLQACLLYTSDAAD